MTEIPAHVRQIYQEYLRGHRNSSRHDRWQHVLDRIEHAMPHGLADHRGLQIAFEQLEAEYESTSPA